MRVAHLLEYYGPTVKCPVKICGKDKSEILIIKTKDKRPDYEIMESYVVGVDIDKTDKDNPVLELIISD